MQSLQQLWLLIGHTYSTFECSIHILYVHNT
uniref:Uncharacterized protein n=1 Tax=Lepeophtheirus salmonis TaxID=72036 RepID=A0A0K2VKF1_LEPSM